MSHAIVASASPALDLTCLRAFGQRTACGLAGPLQAAVFAGSMWLLLAGPGFLSDSASTVPVRVEAAR